MYSLANRGTAETVTPEWQVAVDRKWGTGRESYVK